MLRPEAEGLANDRCRLERPELRRGQDHVDLEADPGQVRPEPLGLATALAGQRAGRVLALPRVRITGVGVAEEAEVHSGLAVWRVAGAGQPPGTTLHWYSFELAGASHTELWQMIEVKIHIVGDKEIELAIIIVIHKSCSGGPARIAHSRF